MTLLMNNATLKAWINNSTLHVGGLTVGETLYIYHLNGILVHQSIATSGEAVIPLSGKGVYKKKKSWDTLGNLRFFMYVCDNF